MKFPSLTPAAHPSHKSNSSLWRFVQGRRKAFTLVELLVVIAIIAILASIALPAFQKSMESSRKAACNSNMRQIGVSLISYATDHDGYLPRTVNNGVGAVSSPESSWYMAINPYINSFAKSAGGTYTAVPNNLFLCPSETKRPPEGTVACQYMASTALEASTSTSATTDDAGAGNPPAGPVKIVSIEAPTSTILVTDGYVAIGTYNSKAVADWLTVSGDVAAATVAAAQSLGFRHTEALNALYADGHAASINFADRAATSTKPAAFTSPIWTGR